MFKSILVVCVGNICRSPVGERLLQKALPDVTVHSAGLAAMVGHPADAVAADVAASHGIDVSGHVAQKLTADLGSGYDLILVMEKSHRHEISQRMPRLSGRTMLFGQWVDGGADVPDPYQRPREIHEATVSLIRQAGDAWVSRLRQAG